MNPVAERLTGWSAAEARGHPLHEVFPIFNEDTRAVVENPVDKVLREGMIVGLANHTVLRRRDGSESADRRQRRADPRRGRRARRRRARVPRRRARRSASSCAASFLARRDRGARSRRRLPRRARARSRSSPCRGSPTGRASTSSSRQRQSSSSRSRTSIRRRSSSRASSPALSARSERADRRAERDPHRQVGALSRDSARAARARARATTSTCSIIRELDLRSAMVVPLRGTRARCSARSRSSTRRRTGATREADLAFAEELARRAALIIERRKLEEEAELANRTKDEFLATSATSCARRSRRSSATRRCCERGVARDPAQGARARSCATRPRRRASSRTSSTCRGS